jgi:3-oxoacid CoA-transferase subunit A
VVAIAVAGFTHSEVLKSSYITGDTHGDFRKVVRFCKQHNLTADDTVIVLGDAGINYFGNRRDDEPRMLIAKTPATIFCIHGNHERRPQTMDCYQEAIWNGGIVFQEAVCPNILFAKDGEVFNLNGIKAIAIGGAYSVDKHCRLEKGWSWFADEQPDAATKDSVEARLDALGWHVDIVLSHTCPLRYEPTEAFIEGIDQSAVDKSTEVWLGSIEEKLSYKRWYCGHYHIDKSIDRLQFMFQDIDILRTDNRGLPTRPGNDPFAPTIFYTSDLHFGHENIIRHCDRPFSNVEEMNRALIDNWNARVRSIDQVYIAGDFSYRSQQPVAGYLEQLNGTKHLIVGNHDVSWMKSVNLGKYFASVEKMGEATDSGRRVVLCHYPMMAWPGRGSYLVHGHIHNRRNADYWPLLCTMPQALNAGVDVNGYMPVTLDELIANNAMFRGIQAQ